MKNVCFLITVMIGGGAERVISVLSNELVARGYRVTIFIIHQPLSLAQTDNIDSRVKIVSVQDEAKRINETIKQIKTIKARFVRKIPHRSRNEKYLICRYKIRYYEKVKYLRSYFSRHPQTVAIAFLYDAMYMALLSAQKNTRVIISERGDPRQCLTSRTNLAFFNTMFAKADEMVFQSFDAMQWYKENTNVDGRIIFNPIQPDLPERYVGVRKKKIVNFCRISSQKNLCLLISAFSQFVKDYPDYRLYIYGDAVGSDSEGYVEIINEYVHTLVCKDMIHILPAQKDIHDLIKDYAMFVSSSDFEGMSNSMLEAMAIGLPTICTDCPAGGARAIIKDHENGILVPVNDEEALRKAMCEVAENPELAEKLSINGTKIRDELAVDKIVNQWMEIIND